MFAIYNRMFVDDGYTEEERVRMEHLRLTIVLKTSPVTAIQKSDSLLIYTQDVQNVSVYRLMEAINI